MTNPGTNPAKVIVTCDCGFEMLVSVAHIGKTGTCVSCKKKLKITTENTRPFVEPPSAAAPSGRQQDDLSQLIIRARELEGQERYSEAAETCKSILAQDDTHVEAWYTLGLCYYRLGDLEQSRLVLQKADELGHRPAKVLLREVESAGPAGQPHEAQPAPPPPPDASPATGPLESPKAPPPAIEFEFLGTPVALWGRTLLALLVTVVTLGIGYPFMLVYVTKWMAHNTLIAGERLEFRGRGSALLGWLVLLPFFAVFTLGIGTLWVPYLVTRWFLHNTYRQDQQFEFDADFAECWGVSWIYMWVFPMLTLSLLLPWGLKRWTMWLCTRTFVGGRQLEFRGSAMTLFGWMLLNIVLYPVHILSLGFTACLVAIQIAKWYVRNLRFAEARVPQV